MKILLTFAFLALLAASACSTGECNAGCLCNAVDSCPSGCFVTQPSGGGAEFCSNGVVACGDGAWSTGASATNQCGGAAPVSVATGPAGAVCCGSATDSGTD